MDEIVIAEEDIVVVKEPMTDIDSEPFKSLGDLSFTARLGGFRLVGERLVPNTDPVSYDYVVEHDDGSREVVYDCRIIQNPQEEDVSQAELMSIEAFFKVGRREAV